MSPEINRLVSRFMKEPIQISIERPTLTVPTIEQVYYEVVFSSRIDSFRKGSLRLLVATDIAARGLDVDDVDAVVNF